MEVRAIYEGGLNNKDLQQLPPVLIVQPTIKVERVPGGMTLSWETSESYVLQSTPSLAAPDWQPVPDVVYNSVTITFTGADTFYRLLRQ